MSGKHRIAVTYLLLLDFGLLRADDALNSDKIMVVDKHV